MATAPSNGARPPGATVSAHRHGRLERRHEPGRRGGPRRKRLAGLVSGADGSRINALCARRGDDDHCALPSASGAALRAAADDTAWDGEWYLRGFYERRHAVGVIVQRGVSHRRHCAVMGVAASRRRRRAPARGYARSGGSELVDRQAGVDSSLQATPSTGRPTTPATSRARRACVRTAANTPTPPLWTIWAFAELGDGDRAVDLFSLINPIRHAETAAQVQQYAIEPYVVAADVYTAAEHPVKAAGAGIPARRPWMHRLGVEGILGVQRIDDCLRLDPCLASAWPEVTVTLRYGRARYRIHMENPDGVCRGVAFVELDGVRLHDATVPLVDDGGSPGACASGHVDGAVEAA
ncbi:MAG: hypothetical protein R2854_20515 [Caldilineaceae bacterium]